MENRLSRFNISSATLHIIAMATMFCDHLWATNALNSDWLSCIGRIAYPIFAFLIAQGFAHTSNVKKYILRMLIFAVISEVPFDLMYYGLPFYPFHQNVMWTYIVALLALWAIDTIKKKHKLWLTIILSALIMLVSIALAQITMMDFYGAGVALVFVFYFFRGRKWWCYLCQLAAMLYINAEVLATYFYNVTIFGHEIELYQQWFAMLALIPIWLYRGRQGHHSKKFRYFCYAFYPAHILILALFMIN